MDERRLVGVGLGPGDPEMLTCKAVRLLREADVVLVPGIVDDAAAEPGRAEHAVRAHVDDQGDVQRVAAGDEQDSGSGEVLHREADWDQARDAVLAAFAAGRRTVAYATLGDPSVYSTFGHLADAVRRIDPSVTIEVVPGITAMQALAAASLTPLVEGTESLSLVPAVAGLAAFTHALEHSDTVVAYQGGRYLAAMHGELTRRGRLQGSVLGREVGLPGERITSLSDLPPGERGDDLTTVIVPAPRDDRGAKGRS